MNERSDTANEEKRERGLERLLSRYVLRMGGQVEVEVGESVGERVLRKEKKYEGI